MWPKTGMKYQIFYNLLNYSAVESGTADGEKKFYVFRSPLGIFIAQIHQ
jgi:hypothetical protein